MPEIYQKAKGKIQERNLAEWMTKISGVRYRRTPLSGGLHLDFPGDAMKVEQKESIFDRVLPEAKWQKNLSVKEWIKQQETALKDTEWKYFFIMFRYMGKDYFILNKEWMENLCLKNLMSKAD